MLSNKNLKRNPARHRDMLLINHLSRIHLIKLTLKCDSTISPFTFKIRTLLLKVTKLFHS